MFDHTLLVPFQSSCASEIVGWAEAAEDARYWAGISVPVETSVFDGWHADAEVQPYILLADRIPVGYGEVWADEGEQEAELARILVKPDKRGKGMGRRLVSLLLEQAKLIGYPDAFVRVYPENQAAITCYLRAGFAPVPPQAQEQYNQGQPVQYVWLHHALTC